MPETKTIERKFIEDAAAYLRFSLRQNTPPIEILRTLTHDIAGLDKREECFDPRVSGYALIEAAREHAQKPSGYERPWDCTGTWDGSQVGTDADSGL